MGPNRYKFTRRMPLPYRTDKHRFKYCVRVGVTKFAFQFAVITACDFPFQLKKPFARCRVTPLHAKTTKWYWSPMCYGAVCPQPRLVCVIPTTPMLPGPTVKAAPQPPSSWKASVTGSLAAQYRTTGLDWAKTLAKVCPNTSRSALCALFLQPRQKQHSLWVLPQRQQRR